MRGINKSTQHLIAAAVLGLVASSEVRHACAQDRAPNVETRADRLLREMGDYLSSRQAFAFETQVTYDSVLGDGQKIQYGGTANISIMRPDRMRAEYRGDERKSSAVFDGRTFTIHDLAMNVYAVTAVPADIDAALDLVVEKFGFSVPIADLAYADPYSTLIESVEEGFWVGLHPVDGTPCHHLAFSQESIDWQIWIEDGPRPVPRKLLITYKDEPGSPQYTARLSGWDFTPSFSHTYFEFHPPLEADEIEFLPVPSDLPAVQTEVDR